MIKLTKVFQILILINLLSSCQSIKDFRIPGIKDINEKESNSQVKKKDSLEIRISCGDRKIKEFLDKGWKIKSEYSEEKICSWKTVPANKKCNMERDKGCKITKPDVIGKETYYLLEK